MRTQVQYSPHDSIVLVAHTGLFVELASRHAAPHVREQQPGVLRALAAGQVAPCAVAWFALDFDQTNPNPDPKSKPTVTLTVSKMLK